MLYSNFEKLNSFNGMLQQLNGFCVNKIVEAKKYICLTKIEEKYFNILSNWKKFTDYYSIEKEVIRDFGKNKILLIYLALMFKEKYITFIKSKISSNSYYNNLKIRILLNLFISTIKYGDKILISKNKLELSKSGLVRNFRIYAFLVNPMFFYSDLQMLEFSQAVLLKKILKVDLNWSVEKTFKKLNIYENNLFDIKIFNLEKEIIKKTSNSESESSDMYANLVYDTYIKLLVKFISQNICKNSI